MDARNVAGLFDDEEDEPMMEVDESTLDNRFLLDLKPNAVSKYIDYLKEQMLTGEGETTVELGMPLDSGDGPKGTSTNGGVEAHVDALRTDR